MTPALTPDQPKPQVQERTQDNPAPQTPDDTLKSAGVTKEDEKNFIELIRGYTMDWMPQRRAASRQTLRIVEYFKGNQYISFDPQNFRYYDPFDRSGSGMQGKGGSEQGNDEDFYKYVTNIIQWLMRVLVASLTTAAPVTRFWPANAENDEDVTAAKQASEAEAYIEQQNNIAALLRQEIFYLGVSGCYFKHTRYMRDADRLDTHQEPIYAMAPQNISEDHYNCPACGAETPADIKTAMGSPRCQQCGKELSDADYYPAETVNIPQQVGSEEVPNGQVVWSLYNNLHVGVAPDANETTTDPLLNTPMLKLDTEVDVAAVRASYPKAWDDINKQTGGITEDVERIYRERVTVPQGAWARIPANNRPTLSRTWIQPWAFNRVEKQEDADALRAK